MIAFPPTVADLPLVLGSAVAAYLLGSIPFGVIVARAHGVDILKQGSGNPGATNVKRVVGNRAGTLVFALDFLKGLLPVLGARWLAGGEGGGVWLGAVALLAAMLGHIFSPWLRFRGGKGIATGGGAFAGLMPVPFAVALAVWVAVLYGLRYVSLASILAAVSLPVTALATRQPAWLTVLAVVVAFLVAWTHRANLARLRAGTEPRAFRPKEARG